MPRPVGIPISHVARIEKFFQSISCLTTYQDFLGNSGPYCSTVSCTSTESTHCHIPIPTTITFVNQCSVGGGNKRYVGFADLSGDSEGISPCRSSQFFNNAFSYALAERPFRRPTTNYKRNDFRDSEFLRWSDSIVLQRFRKFLPHCPNRVFYWK